MRASFAAKEPSNPQLEKMSTTLVSLPCVLLILLSSVSCNNGGSLPPPPKKALFVFGDSLFDPGNNPYVDPSQRVVAAHWPYGITFFNHPTGRISDGRVVPDFIAMFAKLPIFEAYLKPGPHHDYTNGANFASGAAAVINVAPFGHIPFPKQVSYFKDVVNSLKHKYGEKEANRILGSAVYLFSIGGNDYFFLPQNLTASQQAQHVRNVIGNLTSSLKEVYRLGGRKIAFQNVGALGCTPYNRAKSTNGDCVEFLLGMARRHNRALSAILHKLERTLPGFKYSIFDYYNAILDMGDNPSKYGLKEGKSACCGSGAYRGNGCGGGFSGNEPFEVCSNPNDHLWFDGGHTTDSANKRLAELIWNGSPQPITGPYTVKQLFEYV